MSVSYAGLDGSSFHAAAAAQTKTMAATIARKRGCFVWALLHSVGSDAAAVSLSFSAAKGSRASWGLGTVPASASLHKVFSRSVSCHAELNRNQATRLSIDEAIQVSSAA
jgi:hypothetical protein